MSRLSPSVLVIIMMVSLLFIFLGPGEQDRLLVGIITLVILALGLFLAFSGGTIEQRETSRRMLGILTGFSALACAALLGQWKLNNNLIGFICAPVLLAALYMGFIALVSRSGLNVEEGEILISQRRMDHQHVIRPPGLHSPMVAGLEQGIAIMPSYNIETDVTLENIDTKYLHRVSLISVDTCSRIIQHYPERPNQRLPVELRYEGFLRLPNHYPNRDRVFKQIAEELGKPVDEARMTADFWIKAIQLQIAHDVDEELRDIIHNYAFPTEDGGTTFLGPTDISARRAQIAAVLKERLQEKVQHWGVEMLEVSLTQVELDPERIKFFYKDRILEAQEREARLQAEIEALRKRIVAKAEQEILEKQYSLEEAHQQKQLEAEIQALREQHNVDSLAVLQMINEFMESMQKYDAHLDANDIQRLLLLALEEHKRLQYRSSSSSSKSGSTSGTSKT